MTMINQSLADAFTRIADLMEISGESGFRVNSYRRVARFLESHPADIAVAAADGSLTDLPGIGKGTADRIQEFIATGRIALLEELAATLPSGLPDLLRIPGLGPKKVATIHQSLGVAGMDDLKRVIASGALAELPGFGKQSVKRIAEGLTFAEQSGERTPMGIAFPIARELADAVAAIEGVQRVEIAGSLRRGAETIGDVDLLCECADGAPVVTAFTALSSVKRVLARGDTKGSVTVALERDRELQVDLRVVPAESFGAALQYFTGSKEHNVRLREIAVGRKWKLNEWGLFDGDKQLAGKTEESIYKKLGVTWVPPEIREHAGEFDLDETPTLVTVEDIRGDLHTHTTASDGKNTIDEMAEAAKARGYEYLAITDHSQSSRIANGLTLDRMKQHLADVRAAGKRIKGITLLTGCECDILTDGKMDYPDEILAECDIVVASIHSAMTGGQRTPTERLIAAMENKYVTIIGHATGRLLGARPPMDMDMTQVVQFAAETGTAMEINASWQRLDLKAEHVRLAIAAGVMLTLDTDSHRAAGLAQIDYGIRTARRGWATPADVLNTRSLDALQEWTARKRCS